MRLPEKMGNLSLEDRNALGEFYNTYSNKQWFDKAEIVANTSESRKTLEVSVNYAPLLEMKEILSFALKYNLKVETTDLSHR